MEARKKSFNGIVVSDKMDKTIVVEVTNRTLHPLYMTRRMMLMQATQ